MKTRLCSLCSNLAFGLTLMVGTGMLVTSCRDDQDQLQLENEYPEWLGSSIYSTLKDGQYGKFKNTLRLIDDLGYASVLSKTGSRTVFVADDEAWNRFFTDRERNPWLSDSRPTMTYDDLTLAQKKWIMNNSMINAPYLIERLSTTTGSSEGQALRRTAFTSQVDSVKLYAGENRSELSVLAGSSLWDRALSTDTVRIGYARNDDAPIVHFLSDLRANKGMTDHDMEVMVGADRYADGAFEYKGAAAENKTFIFDVPVIRQDITCQNGYIHILGDVLAPPSNMADELSKQEDCQTFSKFLDRYTMPVWIGTENGKDVYRKTYFATKGAVGDSYAQAGANGLLKDSLGDDQAGIAYDPTWHQNTYSSETYQQNMAAMFVPTDEALEEWWNSSTGQLVMAGKANWDEVPNSLLNLLINNHMKENFFSTLPSNFSKVLNANGNVQGVEESDVVRTLVTNNGVVYIINTVYTPDDYISVMAPLHNVENLTLMKNMVGHTDRTKYIPQGYGTYLNSMESTFSLFIPNNEALSQYIDPIYYAAGQDAAAYRLISFSESSNSDWMDGGDPAQSYNITARYTDYPAGTSGNIEGTKGKALIKDLLENSIVVMGAEDKVGENYWTKGGYYVTKGGATIYVDKFAKGGKVYGGGGRIVNGQFEQYTPAEIVLFYNQSKAAMDNAGVSDPGSQGNGVSMQLDAPIMPTRKSVLDALGEHDEFSEFLNLLTDASISEIPLIAGFSTRADSVKLYAPTYVPTSGSGASAKRLAKGPIISFLGNHNYTLFAPDNTAMEKAYAEGLPRWSDVLALDPEDLVAQRAMCRKILSFIRTHFQDTSVPTDGAAGYHKTQSFDSEEGVFFDVYFDPAAGTVYTRKMNSYGESPVSLNEKESKVPSMDNRSNIISRDYKFSDVPTSASATIATSAHVLIHSVNGPLFVSEKKTFKNPETGETWTGRAQFAPNGYVEQ